MEVREIKDIVTPVLEKYGTELVAAYLFGSTAGGRVTPLSDIDIALLLAEDAARRSADIRFRLYADLCRAMKRNDVDIVILNTLSNLIFKDEIVRNAVLIFDGDAEVREEFETRTIHACIDFRMQRRKAVGF